MAKITPNSKPAKPQAEPKAKPNKRPGFAGQGPFETAVPEGFSFKEFKPLKKKDFKTTATYFDHLAAAYSYKATAMTEKAEKERAYGSTADRSKVKRLEKGIEKMQELIATLKASGTDVSKFEAMLAAQLAAPAETAAE